MVDIVLATLNARWIHAAFGLRYLRANLGELRERSTLIEGEIQQRPIDFVERILAHEPKIVGLSVYVWNATAMLAVVRILREVAPTVRIVLGGPEVSHETEQQAICTLAHHVVRGEGEIAFRDLCRRILDRDTNLPWLYSPSPPPLDSLALPYEEYDGRDIAHRVVYVEASRGCPFECEFCLSSLDERVRNFPLDAFLDAMARLLDRGLRHFKFVDRTFNLGVATSTRILRFFRDRWREGMLLHFEMIPDRLPDALRAEIAAFPPGALQFEVGIQSFDPAVGERIRRRQDFARLEDNFRFLRESTGVHVHADLIVGLPGEDLASFADGFDRLIALRPQEIQVGILKRLRGTTLDRHSPEWGTVYATEPPYEILQSRTLSFTELQRMRRFARFFDLVHNSGNFGATTELLLRADSPFARFLHFSDWLFDQTGAAHGIARARLAALLFRYLTAELRLPESAVGTAMARDFLHARPNDWPEFLRPWLREQASRFTPDDNPAARRQQKHLLARQTED